MAERPRMATRIVRLQHPQCPAPLTVRVRAESQEKAVAEARRALALFGADAANYHEVEEVR